MARPAPVTAEPCAPRRSGSAAARPSRRGAGLAGEFRLAPGPAGVPAAVRPRDAGRAERAAPDVSGMIDPPAPPPARRPRPALPGRPRLRPMREITAPIPVPERKAADHRLTEGLSVRRLAEIRRPRPFTGRRVLPQDGPEKGRARFPASSRPRKVPARLREAPPPPLPPPPGNRVPRRERVLLRSDRGGGCGIAAPLECRAHSPYSPRHSLPLRRLVRSPRRSPRARRRAARPRRDRRVSSPRAGEPRAALPDSGGVPADAGSAGQTAYASVAVRRLLLRAALSRAASGGPPPAVIPHRQPKLSYHNRNLSQRHQPRRPRQLVDADLELRRWPAGHSGVEQRVPR